MTDREPKIVPCAKRSCLDFTVYPWTPYNDFAYWLCPKHRGEPTSGGKLINP